MKTNTSSKATEIAGIVLLITALIPGTSEKVLLTKFNPECLREADYYKIKIETSAALSPELPNIRSKNKLKEASTYFLRKKLTQSDFPKQFPSHSGISRNIDPNFSKSRAETLQHSPSWSWIEQKVNAANKRGLNSQEGLLSRAINNGRERGRIQVSEWSNENEVTGVSSWIDRSPITLTSIKTDKGLEANCRTTLINQRLIQRGHILPWLSAPHVFIDRTQAKILFHPKLQTLLAKTADSNVKRLYFDLETSRGYLISLGAPDFSLTIRFALALIGLSLLAYSYKREATDRPATNEGSNSQHTRIPIKLIATNALVLAFTCFGALSLIEIILTNTNWLDESNSDNPTYLPLHEILRYEQDMRERFLAINEYGFVDRPVSLYNEASSCTISILGDSFVWGYGGGAKNSERWTSQLEKLIPGCKIRHWGIGGWSTKDQIKFMRDKGIHHPSNLIILGFVDNDLDLKSENEKNNIQTVNELKTLIGSTPFLVLFTPWNGSEDHQKTFKKASELFTRLEILNHSCLEDVQKVAGKGDAPRHMWIGANVDRHPGVPITTAIADCALKHISNLKGFERISSAELIN